VNGSVLHIVPTLARSDGISAATAWMIDCGLEHSSWTPRLLTARYPNEPLREETLTQLGPSAVVLEVQAPFVGSIGRKIGVPQGFASALARDTSKDTVAHIHGLWRYPSLVGAPLLRRLGVPYVMSVHGLLMPGPLRHRGVPKRVALRLLEKRNLEAAAAVLVSSRLERAGLERLNLHLANVVEVAPGLTRAATDFLWRTVRPAATVRKVILCVARLHPIKRISELLAAFATLASDNPTWDLHVVGPEEDSTYARQLRDFVDTAGLSKRVSFAGVVNGEALWLRYLSADLFVLPSSTENFGLAVLEALTAGIPVIATTGTIWSELPEVGCGWWVEATAAGLRSALVAAMALPDDSRRAMGQRGAAFAERKYSRSQATLRISEVYGHAHAQRAGSA
jgi:glycosyltransferase involved in cell wall biosynthesis